MQPVENKKEMHLVLNNLFFFALLAGCRHSRDISGGLDIHGQGIHGSSSKEQPLHVSHVHYDWHRLCRHCTINSRMYRSFEGEVEHNSRSNFRPLPIREEKNCLEIMIGDAHNYQ